MPNESCNICKIVSDRGSGMLHEEEHTAILLHKMPATSGHLLVVTKEHYPILEQVPDYVIARMFVLANKMSSLLFESLNIQGTNLLIANGVEAGQEAAHVMINVLGRVEGDGLSMQWQPRQVSEEEMGTVELLLKEECKTIDEFEKEKTQPVILDHAAEHAPPAKGHGDDYRLKHWRKIP